MPYWRKKGRIRNLMDAIRKRERRQTKTKPVLRGLCHNRESSLYASDPGSARRAFQYLGQDDTIFGVAA
jgi:hypothetical protein